jgi:hypothetical protein
MTDSEATVLHQTMLALSQRGCTVFRANVGMYYTKDGRPIRTGLPMGFSDLFGVLPDGRVFFCEVKSSTGRLRGEQANFLNAMRQRGHIAIVARSADEAVAVLLG